MTCTINLGQGVFCDAPVPDGSPLSLCGDHLMEAYSFCASLIDVRRAENQSGITREQTVQAVNDAHAAAPPSDLTYVYYIRRGDLIKIGYSAALAQRFASLMPDEVLAIEPGDREHERRMHLRFRRSLAMGREYFRQTEDLVEHVRAVRRANGYPQLLIDAQEKVLRKRGPGLLVCPACDLRAVACGDTPTCHACGWSEAYAS